MPLQWRGGGEKIILPDNYQRIEYIEGTGKQYIGTYLNASILSNSTYDFVITFSTTNGAYRTEYMLSVYTDNKNFIKFFLNLNSSGMVGRLQVCSKGNYIINSQTPSIGDRHWYGGETHTLKVHIENGQQIIVIDDFETIISTSTYTDMKTNKYWYLFGDSWAIQTHPKCRLYRAQFYTNDILVGDFIPCYAKSSVSAPALFDIVNERFCSSAGGYFIAGPVI